MLHIPFRRSFCDQPRLNERRISRIVPRSLFPKVAAIKQFPVQKLFSMQVIIVKFLHQFLCFVA